MAYNLFEKYKGEGDAGFLFAMTAIAYQKGEEDEAKGYLRQLLQVNREAKKFLLDDGSRKSTTYMIQNRSAYYRPHSMEELYMTVKEQSVFYDNMDVFFLWVRQEVRGMKATRRKK